MRTIAIDFETYYDKECSVKTLGNWAYAHHKDFEAYMVSVYDGNEAWAGHPKDLNWDALDGARLLSHNAGFDIAVYSAEAERGRVPWINIPSWHCTANLSVALCGFRNLKQASECLLAGRLVKLIGTEGVSKAMRGSAEGVRYEEFVRDPAKWEAMCDYAKHDAILCWHIWDLYADKLSPLEHRMSDETVRLAIEGVKVDWALVEKYEAWVHNDLVETRLHLPWVVDGKPETSPLAIKDHCAKMGIPVPPVKDEDEEGYERWVEENREAHPWVPKISEYRKLSKMAAFLKRLRDRRRSDDCIDAQLLYFGAHTGRWAGAMGERGSSGINLQNLRKEALQTSSGPVNQRHVFIPKHDKFIIADYAQIEARIVNWLASNYDLLQLISGGMNIYEAHARMTMGWTGGKLKDEDPKTYALAKARVLMLGYGAGWEKFRDTAFKLMGLKISDEESFKIVQEFRRSNPLIVSLWRSMDEMLTAASRCPEGENVLHVQLPSGRFLVYNHISRKQTPGMVPDWDKDPTGIKKKAGLVVTRTADVGGSWVHLYGGKLVENLVQATARDVFAEGLARLIDRGWHIPLHIHDEVVVDVPSSVTMEEVVKELEVVPPWAEGLPIGVEAHESDHYCKD